MFSVSDAAAASFIVIVLLRLLILIPKLLRELKSNMTLRDETVGGNVNNGPLISIVIAAKDESENIEAAAASILNSSYSNIELILVDDRSQDNTFELMRRICDNDNRVKLVRVTEIPDGWTGKTNALSRGVQSAKGDIYLFSDADAFFSKNLILDAFTTFQRKQLDLLSLLPSFSESGFLEKAIYPHMALGLSYFMPLSEVNDPKIKGAGLASGCFIMIRPEAYNKLGGWERFRSEITEDIAISKAAKKAGMSVMVRLAGAQLRTTPFRTLGAMTRFWVRTFYGGLNKSPAKSFTLLINYFSLTIVFALFVYYAFSFITGAGSVAQTYLMLAYGMTLSGVIGSSSIFLKKYNGETIYGIYSPLGIMVGAWIAVDLLTNVLSGRGVKWRGANYR